MFATVKLTPPTVLRVKATGLPLSAMVELIVSFLVPATNKPLPLPAVSVPPVIVPPLVAVGVTRMPPEEITFVPLKVSPADVVLLKRTELKVCAEATVAPTETPVLVAPPVALLESVSVVPLIAVIVDPQERLLKRSGPPLQVPPRCSRWLSRCRS